VFAYQGDPSWLLVTIRAAPSPGRYDVRVVTVNGDSWSIGSCATNGSNCSMGNTIRVDVTRVQAVRLSQPGTPTLTARFR